MPYYGKEYSSLFFGPKYLIHSKPKFALFTSQKKPPDVFYEKRPRPATLLKKDSGTGVFL